VSSGRAAGSPHATTSAKPGQSGRSADDSRPRSRSAGAAAAVEEDDVVEQSSHVAAVTARCTFDDDDDDDVADDVIDDVISSARCLQPRHGLDRRRRAADVSPLSSGSSVRFVVVVDQPTCNGVLV